MYIKSILHRKGEAMIVTHPAEDVVTAARLLADRRIGALPVMNIDQELIGLLTERDIVRAIGVHGEKALSMKVREIMSTQVPVCCPQDSIKEVMTVMTARRYRHIPVMQDGELVGIISLGDVIKNRLDETETEANMLRDYIIASR